MSKFDELYESALRARSGRKGRFIKPEKARELLLKIRKNATASVSWTQLMDLLEIFGWEISFYTTFVKMYGDGKYGGGADRDPETPNTEYIRGYGGTPEQNRTDLERKRQNLLVGHVTKLPKTATPGEHYVVEIGKIKDIDGVPAFEYRDWAGAWGIKFTTPGGATIGYDPENFDLAHKNLDRFLTGANEPLPAQFSPLDNKITKAIYKDPEFRSAVIEALEMEEHEPSAPRTTENSGTCGYCFRNIKLSRDGGLHMVMHGYRRPGHGYVVGNCGGVKFGPFELTPDGTKARVRDEKSTLDFFTNQLRLIEKGGEDVIFMSTYGLPYSPKAQEPRPVTSSMKEWKTVRSRAVARLKDQAALSQDSVDLFEALVAGWEKKPLPGAGTPHRSPLLKLERKHNAEDGLPEADEAK